ncbi:MAG TPA: ATP-binding protein [Actinomycetota bacterium]|nr:ATP-binding protein [Actinomycetota bacterium]
MPVTVLVCDRPETVDETAHAVSSAGHEVELAVEGFRAVELAERTHPEVVVFRTGLPGRPAADVVRRLKAFGIPPHVVVILAEQNVEEAADVLAAGADAVIGPDPHPEYVSWTVDRVAEGGAVLAPGIARELVDRFAETVRMKEEWSRSLADSAQQTEGLSRAKADLLANVSHELRTPLTVIKGLVSVMRRSEASPEDQGEFLRLVEEAADKLTAMVDNLVTLSEMERGTLRLDLQPYDLAQLVQEGAEQAGATYPDVSVEVSVPHPIPATVDVDRLREAVRQLVDNACRYSAPGETVKVRARLGDEGIAVHVSDRGRGLRRDTVRAAFGQPFTPGEDILRKERAGLGMGLNLARHLVVLHGGIMWAEPLPGGGTRVAFTLPPGGTGAEAMRSQPAAPRSRLKELPAPEGFHSIDEDEEDSGPERDQAAPETDEAETDEAEAAVEDPGPRRGELRALRPLDPGHPPQPGGAAAASSSS